MDSGQSLLIRVSSRRPTGHSSRAYMKNLEKHMMSGFSGVPPTPRAKYRGRSSSSWIHFLMSKVPGKKRIWSSALSHHWQTTVNTHSSWSMTVRSGSKGSWISLRSMTSNGHTSKASLTASMKRSCCSKSSMLRPHSRGKALL